MSASNSALCEVHNIRDFKAHLLFLSENNIESCIVSHAIFKKNLDLFKLVQGGMMMQLAMKHFSLSCPHSHSVLHLFLLCRIEGKVHLAAVWTRLWALSLWELMNFGHCRKFSSLSPTAKCRMQFWEELEGKEEFCHWDSGDIKGLLRHFFLCKSEKAAAF